MPSESTIRLPDRRQRPARLVLQRWRTLTGGGKDRNSNRRTLIACSGGADSSALALILRAAGKDLAVSHIVHDLRPKSEAHLDRDAAASLAGQLDLEFIEGEVHVQAQVGNAEGLARQARYDMLVEHANRLHCPFIATAHHADDQLETMLMRLLRGSGPQGLAGIAPSRPLTGNGLSATLIRPMLVITHADGEAVCKQAGWNWTDDATNRDISRTRARIRELVLPELRAIKPNAAERAVEAGSLLREAGELIGVRAGELLPRVEAGQLTILLDTILPEPDVVIGEILRQAITLISQGEAADRVPHRVLRRMIGSIREQPAEPKRFTLRQAEVSINTRHVKIEATNQAQEDNQHA